MLTGFKTSFLRPETKNLLIRKSALINAYLVFAIRYQKDETITMPNMVRMPVSFFTNVAKDLTYGKSTLQWTGRFIN